MKTRNDLDINLEDFMKKRNLTVSQILEMANIEGEVRMELKGKGIKEGKSSLEEVYKACMSLNKYNSEKSSDPLKFNIAKYNYLFKYAMDNDVPLEDLHYLSKGTANLFSYLFITIDQILDNKDIENFLDYVMNRVILVKEDLILYLKEIIDEEKLDFNNRKNIITVKNIIYSLSDEDVPTLSFFEESKESIGFIYKYKDIIYSHKDLIKKMEDLEKKSNDIINKSQDEAFIKTFEYNKEVFGDGFKIYMSRFLSSPVEKFEKLSGPNGSVRFSRLLFSHITAENSILDYVNEDFLNDIDLKRKAYRDKHLPISNFAMNKRVEGEPENWVKDLEKIYKSMEDEIKALDVNKEAEKFCLDKYEKFLKEEGIEELLTSYSARLYSIGRFARFSYLNEKYDIYKFVDEFKDEDDDELFDEMFEYSYLFFEAALLDLRLQRFLKGQYSFREFIAFLSTMTVKIMSNIEDMKDEDLTIKLATNVVVDKYVNYVLSIGKDLADTNDLKALQNLSIIYAAMRKTVFETKVATADEEVVNKKRSLGLSIKEMADIFDKQKDEAHLKAEEIDEFIEKKKFDVARKKMGIILKQVIKEGALTGKELSSILNVPRSVISRVSGGTRFYPDFSMLIDLALIYDISLIDLLPEDALSDIDKRLKKI